MRYWAAWFGARYGLQMDLPGRSRCGGPVHRRPRSALDQSWAGAPAAPRNGAALVEAGFKGNAGAPALNTLMHRISVLSMAHHLAKQTSPCTDSAVKALLSKTREAYAKRNATPHKQRALTKEPLEAVLATCDDSLKGKRDRALLLFAWSSGAAGDLRFRRRCSRTFAAPMKAVASTRWPTVLTRSASHSRARHNSTSVTNEFGRMFGYAAGELCGESWEPLLPSDG
ncbi:hypothetical protein AB4Z46_32800 [Variovorax sp. M-6]|uniref:hypothetical protein n=1 Tax=Variovorax sp. M-6 TaxID=3233041 RepID=UPI003F9AB148